MPIERKEIFQKSNGNIKNSINYIKAISDDDLICSLCRKAYKNKEEINGDINRISNEENNRNHNSLSFFQLYYSESKKNVLCPNCFYKK